MTAYTVSQLAHRAGTTPDTLRYYERIGLLPAPARTPSGYRQYAPEDEERIRFIKRAQRFGLRLDDIGELLSIREQGSCPCGHTHQLLERRLSQLDEELAELASLRRDVAGLLTELEQPNGDGWTCSGALIPLSPTRPEEVHP